jgi:membrane fusion protein (multidrug efflux system)
MVLLLLAALGGSLGYKKFMQIQQQIALGSQVPPPISVTVATAVEEQWERQVKAIGNLVAFQGVNITTEVSGIITKIKFDSGNEVKTGSLLVELDNRTETANLESAQAQLDADDSQYQRLLKLKDQSFVTKNDIDTQASLVNISKAQVRVAEVALAKKKIYAPFSGKLGIRQIDLGEYVTPISNIVTLLSFDKLYLDFTLPEGKFKDLIIDQAIEFKVRAHPDEKFNARVEIWNSQLDTSTRNISVRAVVDNHNRMLAPGMFADMNVRSKRKVSVLTIPETAIFYNIYGEAVYILEKSETADGQEEPYYRLASRQVDVTYRSKGSAGVTSGLAAGDIVVTAGQLKLYPSLPVAIVDDVPEYRSAQQ